MNTRLLRRASAGALALALVAAPTALADVTVADGDNTMPITANGLALGNVCVGQTIENPVLVAISRNGSYGSTNVFKTGSPVTVSVQSVSGTGLSALVTAPGTIALPAGWDGVPNNTISPAVTSSVSVVAGSTPRSLSGAVTYRSTGVDADGKTLTRDASLTVTATVVDCNTPPQIGVNDVTLEGDTLGGRTLTFADIGTATDAQDGTPAVSCIPAIGSLLPLGATAVTCTATDNDGATTADGGQITIEDTIAPSITDAPASTTAEATSGAGAQVSYASPSANDIVWGSVPVTCAPASGSTFALGSTTVSCSATDGSGNTTSSQFSVNVQDTIAPAITVSDVTVEGNTVGGASVAFVSPTATDAVDGETDVTCNYQPGDHFPLGQTTVICTSTDTAGNANTASFVVTVADTTAPVITAADITVEGNTTNGADVTFTTPTAIDIVEGEVPVICDFNPGDFFPIGSTTVTCSSMDSSGNTGTATFSVTVEDTTDPTLVHLPSDEIVEGNTAGGALYGYSAPTASDIVDPSPAVSCTPSPSAFFALGATTVMCTATDASGNSMSDSFVVTVVDTTAPEITDVERTPGANLNGWNHTGVTVSWNCLDLVSGAVDPSPSTTIASEGANQSATATCKDSAGNTASVPVPDINIDLTAPGIEWSGGPQDGVTYYYGSLPAAPTCIATDALSGDGGCSVSGYDTAFGTHTLKATAHDKAGNTTTEERTYTFARWRTSGFYAPVDMNGVWNTVKGGSTVPLKFELFAGAIELTDTAVVKSFSATPVVCNVTGTEDALEFTATGKTALRYDTIEGQFVQNWQTPKTPGICYQTTMTAQDGSKVTAYFKLK